MTRKKHRKNKAREEELRKQEAELNFKPEEFDPDKEDEIQENWRLGFLQIMKEEVFSQNLSGPRFAY